VKHPKSQVEQQSRPKLCFNLTAALVLTASELIGAGTLQPGARLTIAWKAGNIMPGWQETEKKVQVWVR